MITNSDTSSSNTAQLLERLQDTGECPYCDLSNADLSGVDLEEANLMDANLQGTNLAKTDIKLKDIPNNYDLGERLADAFIGLPIFGISSGGVDFFTSFVDANLQGANLNSANINRVDFESANLTNVDFSESNIDPEDLEDLELCGVTFADGTKSHLNCS